MKKLTALFLFTFVCISAYAQDAEVKEKGSNALEAINWEKPTNDLSFKTMSKDVEGEERTNAYNDILFFIGDKQVAETEIKKILPDDIAAIQVIKQKGKIARYTPEEMDGVIIITLKE